MIARLFSRQFFIFCAIGGLNTVIDLGVFNLLGHVFGLSTNLYYIAWKSIAFVAAVINSYFMNRSFTFKQSAQGGKKEFARFIGVTVVTFLLSISVTTLLFVTLRTSTTMSDIVRGNICAVVGVVISVISNFIGYKLFVFKQV